jgi:hypothetical protein
MQTFPTEVSAPGHLCLSSEGVVSSARCSGSSRTMTTPAAWPLAKGGKIEGSTGGDTVSTEAVAARRHAGTHLPVTWWKLEMPITIWHLLLN